MTAVSRKQRWTLRLLRVRITTVVRRIYIDRAKQPKIPLQLQTGQEAPYRRRQRTHVRRPMPARRGANSKSLIYRKKTGLMITQNPTAGYSNNISSTETKQHFYNDQQVEKFAVCYSLEGLFFLKKTKKKHVGHYKTNVLLFLLQ